MSIITKNLKQVTLWADMMPANTTMFLVYSTDGMYRDVFCDTLKRTLRENFIGNIAVVDPHFYIQSVLDELFLFNDSDLLIKITNSIRERNQESLLYKELNTLFSQEIFPHEFIIVNGWKFVLETVCIEQNFNIDNIIKIKLNSSRDSEEISDLFDYRYFDFTFEEFNLDTGGLPSTFNTDMKNMLETIFIGEKK